MAYCLPVSTVENAEDQESQDIRAKFSNYLHEYIIRNALKHGLLAKMTSILVGHAHKPHPHITCPSHSHTEIHI